MPRAKKLGELDVICRACSQLKRVKSNRLIRVTEDVEKILKSKGWKNADTLSPICPECVRAGRSASC